MNHKQNFRELKKSNLLWGRLFIRWGIKTFFESIIYIDSCTPVHESQILHSPLTLISTWSTSIILTETDQNTKSWTCCRSQNLKQVWTTLTCLIVQATLYLKTHFWFTCTICFITSGHNSKLPSGLTGKEVTEHHWRLELACFQIHNRGVFYSGHCYNLSLSLYNTKLDLHNWFGWVVVKHGYLFQLLWLIKTYSCHFNWTWKASQCRQLVKI